MRPAPVRHVSLVAGILAAATLFAGGFGCSKEPAAPQPVVKRHAPKPDAKPPVAQAPPQAKKTEQVALYDSRGKRDPFVSFIRVDRRDGIDFSALPPLQRYELGELKFVGVIWMKKGALALVEDGEGKGYSVTVGTRIGRSRGVVSRITGKEIFVREEFIGNRGQKISRESGIQLTTAGGK